MVYKVNSQGDLIYANGMEGYVGGEPESFWQMVSSRSALPFEQHLLHMTLGSQRVKQNVSLSQLSWDHKENNKATMIEEE